jgi:hypothetical protein
MKHVLKYLLPLVIIVGCTSKKDGINIEQLLEQKAKACKGDSCIVKVADVTPFEWDEVYVFNSPTLKTNIEKAVQLKYDDFEAGTRPLIFVLKDKIVHTENNPDGLAKGTPGQIVLDYPVSLGFKMYTPATAVFKVKIDSGAKKTFYNFQQIGQ